MADRVLTCTTYDTASATCTAEAWVEPASTFGELDPADATELAGAILTLWVIAWCLRWLRKQSESL